MLDVHPPHAATHTWRDFFIHIATIVVGLLIAVALEQSVEAFQHHRESQDLRAALQSESLKIIADSTQVETSETAAIHWLTAVAAQTKSAAATHILPPPPPLQPLGFSVPDDPVWKAASSDGRIALLTPEEVETYHEIDILLANVTTSYQAQFNAAARFHDNTAIAAFDADPNQPQSLADLRQHFTDCTRYSSKIAAFRYWTRQARGASIAASQGERSLTRIAAAERQFDKLP